MSQVTKSKKSDLNTAFTDNFSQFVQELSANAPLSNVRQKAIEHFASVGLPSGKAEEYKYTPIARALEKHFTERDTLPANDPLSSEAESGVRQFLLNTDANHLVFVNGRYHEELSVIVSPEDELRVCPLGEAYKQYAQVIDRYFSSEATIESDPFVALNTAYAQGGVFVHTPKSKTVKHPVICYFISDTASQSIMAHPRNLFVVEENAHVKFAEIFHTIGEGASYNNAVTEIIIDRYAHVHYYKYENESTQAYHTGTTQVKQQDNSHFHAVNISLQGAMIRNNLNIALDAEHCESHMYGLYMLDGNTHVDNHTVVDHQKPNAFSNELYKGIINDKARGVFNGKIYVRQDAQKTNAFQSNANILLSDDASVDTKPQLEIWADDVKCSHGATTGQIDQEQLFYLRTRGLTKIQARAVLLKAFAGDVIQHIGIDALREKIEAQISERLEQ